MRYQSILSEIALLLLFLPIFSQVLLADGTGILILQPEHDALLVVGMLAPQVDHVIAHLHLILADRAGVSVLLHLAVVQLLDFLFAQPLRDLADLIA
jgi:hypothetical protein